MILLLNYLNDIRKDNEITSIIIKMKELVLFLPVDDMTGKLRCATKIKTPPKNNTTKILQNIVLMWMAFIELDKNI